MELLGCSLIETHLAFIVCRPDFNPPVLPLFTLLIIVKVFHWLIEERVKNMGESRETGRLYHITLIILLVALSVVDFVMIFRAYTKIRDEGPGSQMVFFSEYLFLIMGLMRTTIKYIIIYAIEITWEPKTTFLMYTDLAIGVIKATLYVLYFLIMLKYNALPLLVVPALYCVGRDFREAIKVLISSWRTTQQVDNLYPDVSPEQLNVAAPNYFTCTICRGPIVNNCKRLPCRHVFHRGCLISWYRVQQTCPICRLDFLRTFPSAELLHHANTAQDSANQNNPGN